MKSRQADSAAFQLHPDQNPIETERCKGTEHRRQNNRQKKTHMSPKALYPAPHGPRHALPLSPEPSQSWAPRRCRLPLNVRCQQRLVRRIRCRSGRCTPSLRDTNQGEKGTACVPERAGCCLSRAVGCEQQFLTWKAHVSWQLCSPGTFKPMRCRMCRDRTIYVQKKTEQTTAHVQESTTTINTPES